MVDKAFLVGVDDLQEMCGELKNYSLSVKPGSITITQHDGTNGLNDIAFNFPSLQTNQTGWDSIGGGITLLVTGGDPCPTLRFSPQKRSEL